MILVGLITIVGWLAWLAFTLSVISELLAVCLAATHSDPPSGP